MSDESLITEGLKNLMEIDFGPQVYEVEKWWVQKFAEAVGDSNPRWKEVTPPTFPTALILEELDNTITNLKEPLSRSLNGGNELEYFKPIRIGDTITVTGKVVDMKEREGRLGKMVILTSELTYTNQSGEVVAKCRNANVKY